MLTLIDALLAEYPWPSWTDRFLRFHGPDDYVIRRLSLARAFALYAAIGPRYGIEPSGPTYVDQAMMAAKERVSREWAEGGQ